jgi:hypothetical protein
MALLRASLPVALLSLVACGEPSESPPVIVVPPAGPPAVVVVNRGSEASFGLSSASPSEPARGESDVVLRNAAAQRCLDVPRQSKDARTLVWSWDCNGTVAQRWTLRPDPSGGFRLVSRVSGMCLDVPYAATGQNINLWQYTCNGTPAQTWDLEPSASNDGSVLIRSRASKLCVDVPHGQPANGIGVQQYPCHGGAPQRWVLSPG